MVSTKESALFVFCPRPTTTYKKSRPSHIPICLNNHHKTDVFPFFYFHRNFSVVTIHKHLCIIKSQSMLFSIFFRRKSFFKEMTDLAKSYIFDLILYREDKLIILGINFDQYLIFFFGTGFVCIVDQGPTISIRWCSEMPETISLFHTRISVRTYSGARTILL